MRYRSNLTLLSWRLRHPRLVVAFKYWLTGFVLGIFAGYCLGIITFASIMEGVNIGY